MTATPLRMMAAQVDARSLDVETESFRRTSKNVMTAIRSMATGVPTPAQSRHVEMVLFGKALKTAMMATPKIPIPAPTSVVQLSVVTDSFRAMKNVMMAIC